VSILVNGDTRLLVQGITGREGEFHSTAMLEYGTNVELGKKLLQESGLNLYAAADMADGARKIAELAGGEAVPR
jgi:succinyl-CoA synthetase alpha subunit